MTKPESWRYLTEDQTTRLLAALDKLKHERWDTRRWPMAWAWVRLNLYTGLRVGEFTRLLIGHFDAELMKLYVVGSKCRDRDDWDEVWLCQPALEVFREYCWWKEENGESVEPDSPLFLNRDNLPISRRSLARLWSHVCKAADIDRSRVSSYALRHTSLSNLYAATLDLNLVAQQARHSSPSTTMRYVHACPSRQNEARAVLAELY